MCKWIAVLMVMLVVSVVAAQEAERSAKGEEADEKAGEKAEAGIQFLHKLDDAKKQAAETKKKLFIVFGTPT